MSKRANRKAKKKFRTGICPICKGFFHTLTEHHIHKKAVFGDDGVTVFICRRCHDAVEAEISRQENKILRARIVSLYEQTYKDFVEGYYGNRQVSYARRNISSSQEAKSNAA